MVLDHIGIVVRSLEEGIQTWKALFGYHQNSDVVLNTCQKVKVVFLWKSGSLPVKLIEPSEPASPVFAFARRGGGLHHLCFRCKSLTEMVPHLAAQGARFIVPPEPGEAFNNHPIAFFLAGNHLPVELIDTKQRAGWRPVDEDGQVR
jgi:methylmalonyl-CoA/ethylmalonyl-CoA epimerase